LSFLVCKKFVNSSTSLSSWWFVLQSRRRKRTQWSKQSHYGKTFVAATPTNYSDKLNEHVSQNRLICFLIEFWGLVNFGRYIIWSCVQKNDFFSLFLLELVANWVVSEAPLLIEIWWFMLHSSHFFTTWIYQLPFSASGCQHWSPICFALFI